MHAAMIDAHTWPEVLGRYLQATLPSEAYEVVSSLRVAANTLLTKSYDGLDLATKVALLVWQRGPSTTYFSFPSLPDASVACHGR